MTITKDAIGKVLVSEIGGAVTVGRVVETEAYLTGDPACHAFRGPTPRNKPLFGPPGTAYIYLIYGTYWCLNLVTLVEGQGEAVLIRALEPIDGLDIMASRRGHSDPRSLLSGPGKICQAMGISGAQNGRFFSDPPLRLLDDGYKPGPLVSRPRIGLTKNAEVPWRFYPKSSAQWASRK